MGDSPTSLLPLPESHFRSALDSLIEGVNIFDRDLRYVYANPAALAQGRQRLENLLGRRMPELFPAVEQSELYKALVRVAAGGEACQLETPFDFPDGSVGYFRISLEPLPGGGVFLLSMDITAQVSAERALAAAEARQRALLAGLPDLVFLLDDQCMILDVHAPPSIPLLHPRDVLIGQSLTESLPPDVARTTRETLTRVVATGQPGTFQYELPAPDGMRRYEAMMVVSGEQKVTAVVRDVTARVSLEDQLRQAQKMEAIGQLTGGIAHDFNNLLTVISGNAGLLLEQYEHTGEAAPAEVGEVMRAARRGADMVSQLLRFSRRGVLRRQLVDPADTIGRTTAMLERLLPETVRLRIGHIPAGCTLSLDTGALEQIITNLCTNARDAMPTGGVINIECVVATLGPAQLAAYEWLEAGPYFQVRVIDDGAGMDDDTQRRIFEPFFTTKPVGTGTGLGMSMVYGLMKSHRGIVEVASTPGAGTVVTLSFPLAVEAEVPETPDTAPRTVPRGYGGILVVEDDEAIRTATRRALESHGYRVWTAEDGAVGLAVYRAHAAEIALILSDLVMPNLGGHDMANALRAEGATVPMLFTSGYSSDWLFGEQEIPSGIHFMPKPWTLPTLYERVREAIEGVVDGGAVRGEDRAAEETADG